MNNRLALIPITGIMLLTVVGCGTPPKGHGINNAQETSSVTTISQDNSAQNSAGTSSGIHAVSSSSSPSLTTQQLSFQLRGKFLRQMSSPGQGEDCLNSSCSVSGTNFSGPSVTNSNVTLDMVYAKFNGWYIIVAPTTRNALQIAQQFIQKAIDFPHPTGVVVIHRKNAKYYWLNDGKEDFISHKIS